MNKKRIVILDGEQKSALAVTRSLGKAGYKIYVGSPLSSSLAGASKYCIQRFQVYVFRSRPGDDC